MSEAVLLIGASGLAREVLASGLERAAGILDDDVALHGTTVGGVPVLGGIEAARGRSERLLVCIGASRSRRDVVGRLAALGVARGRFATYVAGSARIGTTSVVGAGSILLDGVVVTADASIGDHVVVMPGCTVTHDGVLEDFATLAAGVALGGGVAVGEAAYLGMLSSVRQGVRIGTEATIGMAAAVLRDVPAGETWVGVPARALEVRA
ncbi:NeuD/PglB/VioB family sugar acetyltransferase [Agrococcus carbonis]|uniref:Sugar O-acyltransferase, sialic acid O-acetyltransferase NeuD family n=1 Tax=Agrococcus carbonis TaxID=684552 RepID=A0A1H1LCR8_9MICO|nr:NeuD/PglB/VioB family sugar acetyltransferase [Agrococcus carbonis]SDR72303.1 sugar O-acyltransferase, sialic acid O-acetyltransferase NeuD family [Agrococcus carbonis]